MTVTPYLIFNGDCEEALNFYAKAFPGEVKNLMRFEEVPLDHITVDRKKIMHAVFEAKGFRMMASDSGYDDPSLKDSGVVHLSVDLDNTWEQDRIFDALSQGGKITMALHDSFWGARFGMLTDKFGVKWMFNVEKKQA